MNNSKKDDVVNGGYRLNIGRRAVLKGAAAAGLAAATMRTTPLMAEEELATIKMIYSPQLPWSVGWEVINVANQLGFFKEQGVQIEWVSLPPEQYTAAIDSGRTHMTGFADYSYFIQIFDNGMPVVEIALTSLLADSNIAGDGLFVKNDSPIENPEDLIGKTVAMVSLEWSSAWYTYDWLGQKGIPKEEVKYVAVPTGQTEQVLADGHVDAVYAFGPLDAILRSRGEYRQLYNVGDLAGRRLTRGGTMCLKEYVDENPETVRKYCAAVAKAADWANERPAEVVQLAIDAGRVDPKLAPWVYSADGSGDYSNLAWAEHALQIEEDVRFWMELLERQGIIPTGKYKPSDFYTNEFNPYA